MTAILCRVAWMSKYNGPEPESPFFNKTNLNWLENQPEGERSCGEFWNFLPGSDSKVRGFTMIKAKDKRREYTGTIKIEKLGGSKKDEYVDGITIIFFAPSPHDGKNYVIGWYENARIYRTWRKDGNNAYRNGEFYSFETKPENAYLSLSVKEALRLLQCKRITLDRVLFFTGSQIQPMLILLLIK